MQMDLPDYLYEMPSRATLRAQYGEMFWLAEKVSRNIVLRTILSERQNHRCAMCGIHTNLIKHSKQRATVEHVLTRSRGGRNHPDDCVMTCSRCNGNRKEKVLPEEEMILRWRCEAV